MLCLVTQSCPTLCDPMDCNLPGSSVQDSSGKNTGVGCPALLQGIFPTQGWNTWESPRSKEIKPVNPKGLPWIFIGRTDTLTIMSLLICEHGIISLDFSSSLTSFIRVWWVPHIDLIQFFFTFVFKSSILVAAIVSSIMFLISNGMCSFLICRKLISFFVLALYAATLV